MLIPRMPRYFARATFASRRSTPSLLKPRRLMIASCSITRNMRGLGLPGCGRGVTVPTSRKPKPSAARASRYSPFLSRPAASPTGLGKSIPMTRRDGAWGAPTASSAAPGPSAESDFSVRSWASSGSSLKRAERAREYSIRLGPGLRRGDNALREASPFSPRKPLDRAELVLVAHLAALADPVAEIDVRQAAAARLVDLPEDVVGAVARFRDERIEERVHGGQSVGELVDDRHHPQLARFAEFDEARRHVALQQEVRVLLAAVVVHAAAAMALALVQAIERVMLAVELELRRARLEARVAGEGSALRAVRLEFGSDDAYRNACVAMIAIRPVCEGTAAPKARGHQRAVGLRVDEVARRGDLRARELAGQVAARIGRGRVELQVRDR